MFSGTADTQTVLRVPCPLQLSHLVAKLGSQFVMLTSIFIELSFNIFLEINAYLLGYQGGQGKSFDPKELNERICVNSRLEVNCQSNSCSKMQALCCI